MPYRSGAPFKCKCYERCKKSLIFVEGLKPPFRETDFPWMHHSFKRCADLQKQNGFKAHFDEIKQEKKK